MHKNDGGLAGSKTSNEETANAVTADLREEFELRKTEKLERKAELKSQEKKAVFWYLTSVAAGFATGLSLLVEELNRLDTPGKIFFTTLLIGGAITLKSIYHGIKRLKLQEGILRDGALSLDIMARMMVSLGAFSVGIYVGLKETAIHETTDFARKAIIELVGALGFVGVIAGAIMQIKTYKESPVYKGIVWLVNHLH